MTIPILIGLVLVIFVLLTLWGFFSKRIVQVWNYCIAQLFYYPQSYHDLKGENITLRQELEYTRRIVASLKENVGSLMVSVKTSEATTTRMLEAKGKVQADSEYFQRQEAFYTEQLEEVRRELAAEYSYSAGLKAQLEKNQILRDDLKLVIDEYQVKNKSQAHLIRSLADSLVRHHPFQTGKKSSRVFSELHKR
jgi:nitrogen fixation/metabolism regulation signal transduction histidine kinase